MSTADADLFHGRGIRAKAVGHDALRAAIFLHDALQKLQRRSLVPLRSDHGLQDLAFMIDGSPEIAALSIDLHENLIQMPVPLRISQQRHRRSSALGLRQPRTAQGRGLKTAVTIIVPLANPWLSERF